MERQEGRAEEDVLPSNPALKGCNGKVRHFPGNGHRAAPGEGGQRSLGHANSRTTIEIYTHLSELAMEDSATAIRKAFAQDINSQPYTDVAKLF